MYKGIPLIDGHAHYGWPITPDSLTSVLEQTHADMVSLAALPGCARLNPTLDILAYKHRYPRTTFALGCLDCTAYGEKLSLGQYFVKYAKRMLEAGCDGIKLLEGKPTMRREFPIPDFDDPCWEPFWAFAEQRQLPILWHVNDPENFWNPESVPVYARMSGWGYGPDDVDNEEQYRQVRAVMEAHPKLNVCFAHMFFLSVQLIRLGEWLDRFPNMHVDLTPGIELYENLSADPEQTRAFFDRYIDRIQYGTDIGGRATLNGAKMKINEKESLLRMQYCLTFLGEKCAMGVRADEDYLIGRTPFVLHGLGLPEEMLRKILYDNYIRFIGCSTPWPVNVELCLKECGRMRRTLREYARLAGVEPDCRAVDAAERYFEKAKAALG